MKNYTTILIFTLLGFPSFSQEKVDEELFILSNWSIYSFSEGIPFETSDTMVLFHCGSAYLSNRKECSEQGDFEWECMFNDDDELEKNILVVHGPGSLLSDEGKNDLRNKYMHDDLLFWKLRGKKLIITYGTFITKYKVGKINNQLLTLIRYQSKTDY